MAVPTITNVTPNTVPPYGGMAVTIVGTNFRIPDMVQQQEYWQESVQVIIGGIIIDPEHVRVTLDSEIEVLVPQSLNDPNDYPLAVDVSVQNIDAAGVPIVGENATLVGGLTYISMDLETEGPAGEVFRQIVLYLRRNLGISIVGVVHVDYKTGVTSPWPDTTTDPAIYLVGPKRQTNWAATERIFNKRRSNMRRKGQNRAYDYLYDVVGYVNKGRLLDNMANRFERAIRQCPDLIVVFDGEDLKCEVVISDPPSKPNAIANPFASLQQFQASFMIRGVPEESDLKETEYELTQDVEVTSVPF